MKAQQGSVFRRLGGVQETKEPSVSVKVSSATSLTKTTIKKTFSKPSDIPGNFAFLSIMHKVMAITFWQMLENLH